MREIKFRGKTKKGAYVYGDLFIGRDHMGEIHFCEIETIPSPDKQSRTYRVLKDSVSQLVGIDSRGNEIYEGDLVITSDNRRIRAGMNHFLAVQYFRKAEPYESFDGKRD